MIDHDDSLAILNKVKEKVKSSQVYIDLCKEYNLQPDIIDLVPMRFGKLNVSARTEKGIITFNNTLLHRPKDLDMYCIHELTHHFQQCFGPKATKSSNDDNYLDNPAEQDGFRNQTEYLSETRDDDTAKEYLNQVLDHHQITGPERKEKTKELLRLANKLKFPEEKLNLPAAVLQEDLEKAILRGPQEDHSRHHHHTVLSPEQRKTTLLNLKKLLENLNNPKLTREILPRQTKLL